MAAALKAADCEGKRKINQAKSENRRKPLSESLYIKSRFVVSLMAGTYSRVCGRNANMYSLVRSTHFIRTFFSPTCQRRLEKGGGGWLSSSVSYSRKRPSSFHFHRCLNSLVLPLGWITLEMFLCENDPYNACTLLGVGYCWCFSAFPGLTTSLKSN